MSLIPGITENGYVMAEDMSGDSFDLVAGQFRTKPVAPTTHTALFDAIGKTLTTTVNGVSAVTSLASLDDEATQLAFSAGTLQIKNAAGAVLSSTPIPDLDAQTLSLTGQTLAISGGNSVTLPAGVTVTDNPNGTVTVNAGAGQVQTVIRPIDEQSVAGNLTAADKFTVLNAGTTDHQSITLVELRRRLQTEIAFGEVVSNAPGGVIPATKVVEGVTVPIDTYVDYNGSWASPVTLPVPVHNGQRLVFSHLANLDTTVAVTNSSMTAPLLLTAANKGAEWIAINGQWHLTTSAPAATLPRVPRILEEYKAVAATGTHAIVGPTADALYDTYYISSTIEITAPGVTYTLPVIPAALTLHRIEIDVKAMGAWVGTVSVVPGAGTIDGAAAYSFTKAATTGVNASPSRRFKWANSRWFVV